MIHVHLVLIPILLLVSAIFAASEASLFSLNRAQLETIAATRPSLYRKIKSLLFRPEELLSTLIIGNEIVNITVGTLVVSLLEVNFKHWDSRVLVVVSVLLSSFLMLTTSEVLPKVLAFRIPVLVSSLLVTPMMWAHTLVTPIRKIFLFLSGQITRIFGVRPAPPSAVSEKDFLTLVEVGAESGSLKRDEKDMIVNVFHFSDLPVSSVLTPWSRVFYINDKMSPKEVLSAVREKTYSRIPVVSSENNRVMGVLYTKELLKLLLRPGGKPPADAFNEAIFPPYIVSSHKKISKLFREFKLKKVHIALVVDEYGHHIGVVTLEDLLNALFKTQKKAEAL